VIEWAPQSIDIMSYNDAILYCVFLDYNDHRDWRIPTLQDFRCAGMDPFIYWLDGDTFIGNAYVKPVRYL
jgi:hypothetical protein